jgi:hypothetical protein
MLDRDSEDLPWEERPDVDQALDEMEDSSPRAGALLAGALLDDLLDRLLTKTLPDDNVVKLRDASLDYFGKCQWAYRLGLISVVEFKDLRQIGKIRNTFGHTWSPDVSFDASPVSNWVRNLESPLHELGEVTGAGERLIPKGNVADFAQTSNHHWWLTAVHYMFVRLLMRIDRTAEIEPADPL